jgi:BlaI family penicillinase repressor
MKKLPRISQAEWMVMQVLWPKNSLSADEIVRELSKKTKWKPKTVKTLINRLMRKGAVGFEKDGRKYRYFPAVSENKCVHSETRSFVSRVYGGAAKPMLAAFLEAAELSKQDIDELKRILDQKTEE